MLKAAGRPMIILSSQREREARAANFVKCALTVVFCYYEKGSLKLR